ncbi:meiotically up-regulated gene 113-domain-containing protein [Aspergillus pseudoustus]|uniref:Meiotically up-regulated gene 113-domain-containing protein n=1 Tax=Aspergillus pseudoustus TaxID=1810923 RepID=A0ABR4ILN0_9EURO
MSAGIPFPNPPETPKRVRSRTDSDPVSLSSLGTPLASPGVDAVSVFSPSESVYTEITDYGWESPSRNTENQDEETRPSSSLKIRLGAATNAPDLESPPDIIIHEPNEETNHAQDADVQNRSIRITTKEVVSEEHDATNIEVADGPLVPRKLFEGLLSNDGVQNRRCSFNLEPVLDFVKESQAHRTRPRAKSADAAESDTTVSLEPSRLQTPQSVAHLSQEHAVSKEAAVEEGSEDASSAVAVHNKFRETLDRLIPPSVKDKVLRDEARCVATTQAGSQCSKKPPTPNYRAVFDLLNNIPGLDMQSLLATSKELWEFLLCTIHQKVATRRFAAWVEPAPSVNVSHQALVLQKWLTAVRGAPSSTAYIPPLGKSYNTALPNFVDYRPAIKPPGTSVSRQLEDVLVLPLTQADVDHSGHIYIYQWKGKFGYHKIGYTTDLTARLHSWEKQCGRELTSDFPRSDEDHIPFPHIRRVEKLIHTELGPFRRKEISCPGCSKSHKEWFDIDQDLAMRVVRKWISWIRESPYVQVNGGSTWVLDVHRVGSIGKVCTPLTRETVLQLATSLSVPRDSEGRKRSKSIG